MKNLKIHNKIFKRRGKKSSGVLKSMKQYKFRSVFISLYLFSILLSLIPLLTISIINYYYSNNLVQKNINDESLNYIIQIRESSDAFWEETVNDAWHIASNDEALWFSLFAKVEESPLRTQENVKYINNMFNMLVDEKGYVESVYLYSDENKYIISNIGSGNIWNFIDNEWIKSYETNKLNMKSWHENRIVDINNKEKFYYTLYMTIRNEGVLAVNVNMNEWSEQFRGRLNNQIILVLDENNNIVSSEEEELLFKTVEGYKMFNTEDINNNIIDNEGVIQKSLSDGSKYIVTYAKSEFNNFTYVCINPLTTYINRFQVLKKMLILIVLIGMAGILILSLIASWGVYKPVVDILSMFEDNKIWLEPKKSVNEYNLLKANIIKVINYNQKMENELQYNSESLKRVLSMALQLQINPHFLFNTLETINLMAIEKSQGENQISNMIVNLSKLLRTSLTTSDNFILLSEEIDNLDAYIQIQQQRYKNRFNVKYNINENTKNVKVIKMLLQPLVENGIYHGIKPSNKNDLFIEIKAYKSLSSFIIEIIDNGDGLTNKRIQDIHKNIEDYNFVSFDNHIGLSNIHNRIKIIYGEQYGVELLINEYGGVTSRVTLPLN